MDEVILAALEVQNFLVEKGWPFAFIGGLANIAWGEIRMTQDADVSVFTGFDDEPVANALLSRFPSRVANPIEFALRSRVLLLEGRPGVPVDVALAGFEFEKQAIERSVLVDFGAGASLRVISAEDLIAMKAFAGREKDWADIAGVSARQGSKLDWTYIIEQAQILAVIKEDETMMERLAKYSDAR